MVYSASLFARIHGYVILILSTLPAGSLRMINHSLTELFSNYCRHTAEVVLPLGSRLIYRSAREISATEATIFGAQIWLSADS